MLGVDSSDIGSDSLVAAARELPQLVSLCGLQPKREDIHLDWTDRRVIGGDVKLLAFDLAKNQAIKTLK